MSFADESKTPGTPKELRFSDLRTSVTKPSKKSLEVPVRSVRDRSPTPERFVDLHLYVFFREQRYSSFNFFIVMCLDGKSIVISLVM